jgi:hypothetical protein
VAGSICLGGWQRVRHRLALLLQVLQLALERVAGELDAAVQRLVEAHLEPRVDRALQELERDRVDEAARDEGHEGEHAHQPQRELGAEDALREACGAG